MTAAIVFVGLVIEVVVVFTSTAPGAFPPGILRTLNVFAYFTILSNALVGATNFLLALRLDRPSTLFRALRLSSLVAIIVTGIVYHTVLQGLQNLVGWEVVGDIFVHTIVPVIAPLGWLLFGPRGMFSARIALLATAYPILWLVFTLIRGAIVNWYPYPFVNAAKLGYGKVAINSVVVAIIFVGLAVLLTAVDGWLRDRGVGLVGAASVQS